MAEPSAKIEITPKVIDLGDKVIQLAHVTSVGNGTTHPFRPAGIAAILAGIGLVAFEVVMRGPTAFALKTGGSVLLWLAFGVAGIGLFLTIYAQRRLVIRTADGARTVLPSDDEAASAAIVERIRLALETSGPPVAAEPARSQPLQIGNSPGEGALPARQLTERSLPAATPQTQPQAQIASQPIYTQPLGGSRRPPEGHVNGHGAYTNGSGRSEAELAAEQTAALARRALSQQAPAQRQSLEQALQAAAALSQPRTGPAHSDPQQHAPAREPMALPQAQSPAPQARDDSAHDLHLLMEHVRRSDVQHKDALLDLLRVVEEHYRGRASRDDAIAHWRSFADYVMQYLSDVDGMMPHTERFGRHMLAR